jgi:uncharacterized protein (UPF0297 family)
MNVSIGKVQEREEHDSCPFTDEQIKDVERERTASMCDIEAFEMYKEAEKRGLNPITAINRFYSGELQEWKEHDSCPFIYEQIKDMERERVASMCDIEAFEMHKEAEKRGLNPITAINRFYSGELQEWEEHDTCPYTEEQIIDMERERIASMCDIEAFEMYKEAEKRGYNPMTAINKFYTGEPQEWVK